MTTYTLEQVPPTAIHATKDGTYIQYQDHTHRWVLPGRTVGANPIDAVDALYQVLRLMRQHIGTVHGRWPGKQRNGQLALEWLRDVLVHEWAGSLGARQEVLAARAPSASQEATRMIRDCGGDAAVLVARAGSALGADDLCDLAVAAADEPMSDLDRKLISDRCKRSIAHDLLPRLELPGCLCGRA